MSKLSEITKNLYLKTLRVFGLQVYTDEGFKDIESINITGKQGYLRLITESYTMDCSPNHILIDKDGNEVYAKDSEGVFIKTVDGGCEQVIDVCDTGLEDELYDISLSDASSHCYYVNGLLSHNCVVADEFSFVPNNIASKVFESIYPVISSSKNSQFIIVSTPNGADSSNLYYDLWQKANSKDKDANQDGWKPFKFDWWDVPGRDEQWKRMQIAAIGQTRFDQEFGNQFLTSSTVKKLIPDDIIEKYKIKLSEYKRENINQGKDLAIYSKDGKKTYVFTMYDEFHQGRTYLASSDIGEGIGKDASVLYVWDVTDTSRIKMVLKYSSNSISILEFAYVTLEILKLYGNPFLACESNGISLGYIDQLRTVYGYENFVRMNRDNGCGINSHVSVKSKACMWLRDMMTTAGFGFELYDGDLVEEMTTFIKKDTVTQNVYAALGDNHDDHLMTMIWACYILHPETVERYFVVADTFTSSLGNIYPKRIEPLNEYDSKTLNMIARDPNYRDFLLFKQNLDDKYRKAMEAEEMEKMNETFAMLGQTTRLTPKQVLEMKMQKERNLEKMRSQNQTQDDGIVGGGKFMMTDDFDSFGGGYCGGSWGGGADGVF